MNATSLHQEIDNTEESALCLKRYQKTEEHFLAFMDSFDDPYKIKSSSHEYHITRLRSWALMYQLVGHFETLSNFLNEEEMFRTLKNVSDYFCKSILIKRCQSPELYAGDHLSIEQVTLSNNQTKDSEAGRVLEEQILLLPLCQQHRNKVTYEANLLVKKIHSMKVPKILCLSVGSCSHFINILTFMEGSDFELHVHDTNEEAIRIAKKRLQSLDSKIVFHSGNLIRFMRQIKNESFDLITLGGVADYFSDKSFVSIITNFMGMLRTSGTLFYTHLSCDSYYRTILKYIFMWKIQHRTKDELINLMSQTGVSPGEYKIFFERCQLTYMVEIQK